MAGNQRVYKQRIRSIQTLQKVFRAMELIASSRIGQARRNAQEASPYDHALSQAVAKYCYNVAQKKDVWRRKNVSRCWKRGYYRLGTRVF